MVLDLQKNCEENTDSPYPSHAVAPIIDIWQECGAFVTINWSPHFVQVSLVFT